MTNSSAPLEVDKAQRSSRQGAEEEGEGCQDERIVAHEAVLEPKVGAHKPGGGARVVLRSSRRGWVRGGWVGWLGDAQANDPVRR